MTEYLREQVRHSTQSHTRDPAHHATRAATGPVHADRNHPKDHGARAVPLRVREDLSRRQDADAGGINRIHLLHHERGQRPGAAGQAQVRVRPGHHKRMRQHGHARDGPANDQCAASPPTSQARAGQGDRSGLDGQPQPAQPTPPVPRLRPDDEVEQIRRARLAGEIPMPQPNRGNVEPPKLWPFPYEARDVL